jgi:drug/metabolite transporter (DMT)-like permease
MTSLIDPSLKPSEKTPSFSLPIRLTLAGLGMAVICSIFGGYGVLAHAALGQSSNAHALVFAWLRDMIGTVLLLSTAYFVEMKKSEDVRRFWPKNASDLLRFFLLGLTGVWGAQGMSALSLANMNATLFACFSQMLPVVAFVVCLVIGEEKFNYLAIESWGKLFGVCCAVGGAAFLSVSAGSGGGAGLSAGNANLPAGLFFVTMQLLFGGSYNPIQKGLLGKYPSLVCAAWGYACGLVILSLCVITGTTGDAWVFTEKSLYAVAFSGVFSSYVAYWLMAVCNSLAGPLFVNAFYPFTPIATAIISYIVTGATLTITDLEGALLISIGLLVLVYSKYKEELKKEENKLSILSRDDDTDNDDDDDKEGLLENEI